MVGIGPQSQGLQARVGRFDARGEQGFAILVTCRLQDETVRPGLAVAAGTVR